MSINLIINMLLFFVSLCLPLTSSPAECCSDEEIVTIQKQILDLYLEGRYSEAIPLARKVLEALEDGLDPGDPLIGLSLNNLAQLLHANGDYVEAQRLYRNSLKVLQNSLGADDPDVATTESNLGALLRSLGHYSEAKHLYEHALATLRKNSGSMHPQVATTLGNLGGLYYDMGDYSSAVSCFKEALEISERLEGASSPSVGRILLGLGTAYIGIGDFDNAETINERALGILEKTLPSSHPDVAMARMNFASILDALGKHSRAVALYQRALKDLETTLGPIHPDVAYAYNNLAHVRLAMGQYAAARNLFEQALEIRKQSLGTTHPLVATTMKNLGDTLNAIGDRTGAQSFFEQALQILETRGDSHPDLSKTLNSLAALLMQLGDLPKAKSLFERAVEIDEKELGPQHPGIVVHLGNLASLLHSMGDYAGAAKLYEKALVIGIELRGRNDAGVAAIMNGFALLLDDTGPREDARKIYERALEVLEEVLGATHPKVAGVLHNLGLLAWDTGDKNAGEKWLSRSVTIMNENTRRGLTGLSERHKLSFVQNGESYISAYLSLANEVPHEKAYKGVLLHKNLVFDSLKGERASLSRLHDPRIEELVQQQRRLKQALNLIQYGSPNFLDDEPRKERIRRTQNELDKIQAQLSQSSSSADQEKPLETREICRALPPGTALLDYFRYARFDSGDHGALKRWDNSYGVFVLRSGNCDEIVRAELGKADRIDQAAIALRSVLSGDIWGRALIYLSNNLRQDEVKARLSAVTFHGFDGTSAYLGVPDDDPDWLSNNERDSIIDALSSIVGQRNITLRVVAHGDVKSLNSELQLLPLAQSLGTLVLPAKVRDAIGSSRNLIISPDGTLSLVPFGILPGKDGRTFLLQSYTISFVPSGRDILRYSTEGDDNSPIPEERLLLLGNPDYDAKVGQQKEHDLRSEVQLDNSCGLKTASRFLPLSNHELVSIEHVFTKSRPAGVIVKSEGSKATEDWLTRNITGSRYVHLDTHAFFTGPDCDRIAGLDKALDHIGPQKTGVTDTNPFLHAGIALAGANRRRYAQDSAEDGILTALDVTELDVRGTELVTLSACDTSLGGLLAGQEVQGLRWAFAMAGARSLVTSLWQVPTSTTTTLMNRFYTDLWQKKAGVKIGKAVALQQAQLVVIEKNRKQFAGDSRPADWAAWVLSGDWR
jgi:tetratricopeptide (TPR) repeat protein/CHAT domain-containing protein